VLVVKAHRLGGSASKRAAKLSGDSELSAAGETRGRGDVPASASRTFFRGVALLAGQRHVLPESDRVGRVVSSLIGRVCLHSTRLGGMG